MAIRAGCRLLDVDTAASIGDLRMNAKDFKPWWDKVNNYQNFDERKEFVRGATGVRVNNRQEEIVALYAAGYVNGKFAQPKSLGKKQ